MTWTGTSRPAGVAGDEGRRLVVAEDDEERRRRAARRSAKLADGAQRVVEREAVLVAHPVVVAPDHLGRVAGGRRSGRRPRPSPSASQGRSGGIGVQGACEEMSAISAKTGGRGAGSSSRRSRAARVNWSGIVTQLNGWPR